MFAGGVRGSEGVRGEGDRSRSGGVPGGGGSGAGLAGFSGSGGLGGFSGGGDAVGKGGVGSRGTGVRTGGVRIGMAVSSACVGATEESCRLIVRISCIVCDFDGMVGVGMGSMRSRRISSTDRKDDRDSSMDIH